MMRYLKSLIFLLWGFSSSVMGQGIGSQFKFVHHTTEDGLAQNKVMTITKDGLGFMWFGTEGGVCRFDGYDYQVYNNSQRSSERLLTNNISAMAPGSGGGVWFSTIGGGLYRYDLTQESLFQYLKPQGNKPTDWASKWWNQSSPKDIEQENDSILWLLTNDVLYRANLNDSSFESYPWHTHNDPEKTQIVDLDNLLRDNNGQIWVSAQNGQLARFDGRQFIDQGEIIEKSLGFRLQSIMKLACSKNNVLYIGTKDQGLIKYDPETKKASRIKIPSPDFNDGRSCRISAIMVHSNGTVWVGTWGFGLYIIDPVTGSLSNFRHGEQKSESLAEDHVFSLFEGSFGNVWVGTAAGVDLAIQQAVKKIKNAPPPSGLTDKTVLSLCKDHNGYIWIGTSTGGLNRLDPVTGQIQPFDFESKNIPHTGEITVESILEDRQQRLWFGTHNGLWVMSADRKKVRKYAPHFKAPSSLGLNVINCLFQDDSGLIWIGTDGQGVSVLDPQGGTFDNYQENTNDSTSLSNNSVRSIQQDADGNIWIGTYYGLNLFHPDTKTFQPFYADINSTGTPSEFGIVSMATDMAGRLWIGTYGGGLNWYDQKTHQFKAYNKKDGLAGNFIYSITSDHHGHLWLATEVGVSRATLPNDLDHDMPQFVNYGANSGFPVQGLTFAAINLATTHEIYLGSKDGLIHFNPDSLFRPKDQPKLVVDQLLLYNRPVKVDRPSGILSKNLAELPEISIPYAYRSLSFGYTAHYYINPKEIQYAYKLVPLEEHWNMADDRRMATYTNLEPGQYFFYTKAFDEEGNAESDTVKLTVNIVPPFWMTWWFRTLIALALASILCGLYFWRVGILKKRNAWLEQKVEERTSKLKQALMELQEKQEEIAAQNEELNAQFEELSSQRDHIEEINNELKQAQRGLEDRVKQRTSELVKANQELDSFVYSASHDLSAPLKSILGLIHITKLENKDKALTDHLEHMSHSVHKLEDVIVSLTQFSRNMGHEIKSIEIIFDKIVDEVLDEQKFPFKSDEIKIRRSYGQFDTVNTDYLRLKIILSNLISNALKYTKDNKDNAFVEIKLERGAGHFNIQVIDNGIGISEKNREKIFEMFYRATTKSKGSGLGLYIVKETVNKLNGEIHVSSTTAGESVFSVTLPNG